MQRNGSENERCGTDDGTGGVMKRDLAIVIGIVVLVLGSVGLATYRDSWPTAKSWSNCMLEKMQGQPAMMHPIAEIQCEGYRNDLVKQIILR